MRPITTDEFIEAFAAELVARGRRVMHLNEPAVRRGLLEVYKFLSEQIEHADTPSSRRALVKLRSVFSPSPIGAFDEFEHLMRSKQTYLTRHPNPVYDYIEIGMSLAAAKCVQDSLEGGSAELVRTAVERLVSH